MAEYYPLLAKAVGSLPNSTPETRRVVYERARKALIGQLRTLHPPVPDEDIDHESVELDRAIGRLESELAQAATASPAALPGVTPAPSEPKPVELAPAASSKPTSPMDATPLSTVADKPFPALKTKTPVPRAPGTPVVAPAPPTDPLPPTPPLARVSPPPLVPPGGDAARARLDGQRPIAPQPPVAKGPKRRLWIIPVGIGVVVALVGFAAWKLRDRPETVARVKPVETQNQGEAGKIAERVGGAPTTSSAAPTGTTTPVPAKPAPQTATATPSNPEVPVAHRAALLVEAPNEESKVKTFLGTVVWKLSTVNEGQADAASLAVEADIDLPDDKTKAIVTFQKNTDSSLPASHTIKVRFMVQPGSVTGDVKQINVPQMRREDSPSGEPLAGVTVPVIQNSFLVGLSPGNAETANLEMIRGLQWIDIPMLLDSGKIAKLTFEKSESGQRDLAEAIASWQK